MKHKHHDMICAKAANMDLAQFVKFGDEWIIQGDHENFRIAFEESYQYFLCLPQHKEACLHWLNGGMVQVINDIHTDWEDCGTYAEHPEWYAENWMMSSKNKYRIKPRKEKRWIGVNKDQCTPRNFETRDDAIFWVNANGQSSSDYWQFVEIEIEI